MHPPPFPPTRQGDRKRDRQEDETDRRMRQKWGEKAICWPTWGASGKSRACNYHHIVLNKNLVHNYRSLRYMSVILGL